MSRPARRRSREEMLEAAASLFVERGYHGVGLETVAEKAGITRQTVYNQFGSKAGLLQAVVAFIEERAGLPGHLGRVFAQTDGLSMLRAMLDTVVAVEPIVRPISRVVHAARLDDESAREMWHNRMSSRLMGMTMVMNRLRADGWLRDDVTPEEAAEIAWSFASPHHYEFLVIDRGWTPERYRDHLEQAISSTVLRPRRRAAR